MASGNDSLLDLEKHCRQLEENVKQLQTALQHWRTWDAEYESLKEEVEALPSSAKPEQLSHIRDAFDAELVVGKELNEIFGQQQPKTRDQIVNLLDRRIDYVTKNIESLSQQLEKAENKFAAASVVSAPDAVDEDGQPITEIVEELDDDDNVLSYRLNKPGDSIPHVQDALQKAGVEDIAELQSAMQKTKLAPKKDDSSPKDQAQAAAAPKKSVAFAEDTKSPKDSTPQISNRAMRVEQIMKTAKDQEQQGIVDPVIPDDEDPEDALLRQEMIKYGMGEVGAVVAELELEENEGEFDDDDEEWLDGDDMDDDDDDDDDDNFGRYKGRMITDAYRQRMLELEQKLGIQSRFTAAAEAKAAKEEDDDDDNEGFDERVGKIVVKGQESTATAPASTAAPAKSSLKKATGDAESKKGVKFASTLDIAEASQPAPATAQGVVEPLSDIVERPARPTSTPKASSSQRPSRFKSAKSAPSNTMGQNAIKSDFLPQSEAQPTPTGPPGITIADKLVEKTVTAAPVEPELVDDSMIHFEVADEHHRLRKKFILREGGFLREDETDTQHVDDDDEETPRMSRFKAARLSRQ